MKFYTLRVMILILNVKQYIRDVFSLKETK